MTRLQARRLTKMTSRWRKKMISTRIPKKVDPGSIAWGPANYSFVMEP